MAATRGRQLDRHGAWHLAVRTAAIASVMVATLAVALYQFWGVNRAVLVALAAAGGLALGLRLPAAAPVVTRPRSHRSHR